MLLNITVRYVCNRLKFPVSQGRRSIFIIVRSIDRRIETPKTCMKTMTITPKNWAPDGELIWVLWGHCATIASWSFGIESTSDCEVIASIHQHRGRRVFFPTYLVTQFGGERERDSGKMAEDLTTSVAEEILQLTQDALNLANVACHFDKIENYSGAYDYYDKCILSIDEVMSKLPPSSAQWHQLNVIRAQYDDRMDTLREIEANRNSFFRSSESSTRLTREGSGGSGSKFGFRKKVLSQDDLNFTEIDILQQFTFEAPPASITDIPYWILRNVKRSIVSGAYIAENVFVPKPAWSQTDLKFAGIPAKTTAFEIVLRVVASIENMHISADDVSLSPLEVALHSAQEELLSLQNQLSKPFPYIKEIDTASITPINGSMHGFSGEDGTDTANAGTADGTDEPRESMSTAGRSSVSTKQSTSTNGASGNNGASEKDGGNNRTFSSLVSSFSKGVRKYAEVSFHRLAVALPSKLSSEELNDYTQLIVRVCDKSQVSRSLWVVSPSIADEKLIVVVDVVTALRAVVSTNDRHSRDVDGRHG